MKCSKHPKYSGYKKPKRECSQCLKVWKTKQKEIGNKYNSITTPGFTCGIVHLMCEISTVMIYGKQPGGFWRKNAPVKKEIKDHYQKIFKMLNRWKKNDRDVFKDIETVLYHIFIKPNDKVKNKIKKSFIPKQENTKEDSGLDYFDFEVSPEKSRINIYRKLKEQNGEEKEED